MPFPAMEYKVVLIGLNNIGKTTTLYKLCLGEVDQVVTTHPTMDSNIEELLYKNIRFEMLLMLWQGISIGYLSGRQSTSGVQFGTYSQCDIDALRALAEEPVIVDIFLTGVTNKAVISDVPSGISDSGAANSTISELVAELKPRYHIAGTMGVFYDREPYANLDAAYVTRFMALAPVGNKDKPVFFLL